MTLLDGLSRHLANHSLGTYDSTGAGQTGDWAIFLEALPPQPDRAIALFQYGGPAGDPSHPWDEPRVQVLVSGTEDPRISHDRAAAIYSELHGLQMVTLPDGTWLQDCVGVQSGPVALGPDGNGRHRHVINLACSIDNPTAHRPAL